MQWGEIIFEGAFATIALQYFFEIFAMIPREEQIVL